MDCIDLLELQSYVDHEVTAERRRDIEAHVSTCAVCRARVESLQTVTQAVAAGRDALAAQVEPPSGLSERLLAAVGAAEAGPRFSCRRVAGMLSAYVDGELTPAQASAVEVHVFACDGCFALLSQLRTVTETLAQRPQAVASERLLERIFAALRREAVVAGRETAVTREKAWWRRVAWQPLAAGAAAAAIIIAVVAFPKPAATPVRMAPTPPEVVASGPTDGSATEGAVPSATQPGVQGGSAATSPLVPEQPSAIRRLANALTGGGRDRRGEGVAEPWFGYRPARADVSGTAGYQPPAPYAAPSLPTTPTATPAGHPVATSAEARLPEFQPVSSDTAPRLAALPRAEAPSVSPADEHPRVSSPETVTAVAKAQPSSGGEISLPTPPPAPRASGPELAPRRVPMREAYRSEGLNRDHLERSADRLNKAVPLMRIAGRTNFEIIH